MNDALIRKRFHEQVLVSYHAASSTMVIDELGLQHGSCRADIAIVNGRMIGYEIKGETDSLKRLREQVRAYNAVFDQATVITTTKHRRKVVAKVPRWWGVIICHSAPRRGITFEIWRAAKPNAHVESIAVARLLWKSEAAAMLQKLGEPKRMLRQPRAKLYERLTEILELPQLQRRVRNRLRKRKNWRDLAPLSPSGG
ncbi:MAG TPA: sce7726 family protein [Opitutaceae bacterium]|nr:sce7726 family protein [Opitutaceae bacterium]